MGKRKKKNKNRFPWLESENLFMAHTGHEIITDAGWEKIKRGDAAKFFHQQTISD